eukprot:GHVT01002410.1.p1 GENE.GHVT01002410.1~~GHVT01002410.1.p1  ORF type:complete len:488 (-),score=70.72 GHVT01002410.1:1038-2501(-)
MPSPCLLPMTPAELPVLSDVEFVGDFLPMNETEKGVVESNISGPAVLVDVDDSVVVDQSVLANELTPFMRKNIRPFLDALLAVWKDKKESECDPTSVGHQLAACCLASRVKSPLGIILMSLMSARHSEKALFKCGIDLPPPPMSAISLPLWADECPGDLRKLESFSGLGNPVKPLVTDILPDVLMQNAEDPRTLLCEPGQADAQISALASTIEGPPGAIWALTRHPTNASEAFQRSLSQLGSVVSDEEGSVPRVTLTAGDVELARSMSITILQQKYDLAKLVKSAADLIEYMIDQNVQCTAKSSIAAYLWNLAYKIDLIPSALPSDVLPAFRAWQSWGVSVCTYSTSSSGCHMVHFNNCQGTITATAPTTPAAADSSKTDSGSVENPLFLTDRHLRIENGPNITPIERFYAAAEVLGAPTQLISCVTDKAVDAKAAAEAGMSVILLQRPGAPKPKDLPSSVAVVASLLDIKDLAGATLSPDLGSSTK